MNPYTLIGSALLISVLVGFGLYERGEAEHWHGQYISLQASYNSAADKAKADALAQEAKDTAALKLQSSQAIQQATYAKNQAQLAAATYNQKLAQLAKSKSNDLGHQCASVQIPGDLIP